MKTRGAPGSPAGIESMPEIDRPPPPGAVHFRCIDYADGRTEEFEVDDIQKLFDRAIPDWAKVRWINVDGLHPYIVNQMRLRLGFHTLAAEDVLRVHQRPSCEAFGDHLFVLLRMLRLKNEELFSEQVSLFCFKKLVVSFQEESGGDVWDPVRRRIEAKDPRITTRDAGFLTYVLVDAIVDHFFPLLEHYGERLEAIENQVMQEPGPRLLYELQAIKREITFLRRAMWPTRELVDQIQRGLFSGISDETLTFFRDVHTHAVQIMDIIETYRELWGSLLDLYVSMNSQRLNEVMKVLTIISSLFIPITFLAGVYGMNFEYFPELKWRYAYPMFWFACAILEALLLLWFWRKGWLGEE